MLELHHLLLRVRYGCTKVELELGWVGQFRGCLKASSWLVGRVEAVHQPGRAQLGPVSLTTSSRLPLREGMLELDWWLKDMTPLHLAAAVSAPRLTSYLLDRGEDADAVCDYLVLCLKQATPFDLVAESLNFEPCCSYGNIVAKRIRSWNSHYSIIQLLIYVCLQRRRSLEVLRMLAQKTQKEHMKKAFINYAADGQLVKLIALFLVAPDLFLSWSSFRSMYNILNSAEKWQDIAEGLSLLLDVFAIVGDKLAAFVRLERSDWKHGDYDVQVVAIFSLVQEVADKKLGVSSDEYFLRFISPLCPVARKKNATRIKSLLFPRLTCKDVGGLNRAIEKTLSSMSALHD